MKDDARKVSVGWAGEPTAHDSALKHVTGSATYTDDIALPEGTLHAYLGLSEVASGTVRTLDLSEVVSERGVLGVLTAEDLPGPNDVSPTGADDDPIFAQNVAFWGQPLFAVVAETREIARRAAKRAKVEYDPTPPKLTIDTASDLVTTPLTLKRGDVGEAFSNAPHQLTGSINIGGQDHFYLEGQIAAAIPGEDDTFTIWSSTQHPSEVQHIVAHVLGVAQADITVKVRRMGGGFGGKETQGNIFAAVAALAARKFRRSVKIRPDRDDDMTMTGKRHDMRIDYTVGHDEAGQIHAVELTASARCGFSADLSGPVTDRALFHADNCYYYPAAHFTSRPLRTNTVSNTAFRGFGGPQGLLGAERIIEEVAFATGQDPLDVRKSNLYRDGKDITPYHQQVTDNIALRIIEELEASADYRSRRAACNVHNAEQGATLRGIALTPVKFGISFTATWYNQAGALVHIFKDGSIHLNHGGTEMGQGLNQKVAQVLAEAFAVPVEQVRITATATDKVPNTSATAASSGSDLNGMAALNAAETLKSRLAQFFAEQCGAKREEVSFTRDGVRLGANVVSFNDLVADAYIARVSLSTTGFYKTPGIHWDRAAGKGRPFYYFAYGAACTEVEVDTYTGEYTIPRADILHDVGKSLNPALDLGQVEGGFVQGLEWLTTEELWWDEKGRLRTHAPSTYKIPLASDIPKDFRVHLAEWSQNTERTIRRSKAVGEPPLMLAVSVVEALSMAVASVAKGQVCPRLDTPATPERVLMAIERLKG